MGYKFIEYDSTTGEKKIERDETGISHTKLQDIGTNTHAQIDSHIANTNNPHSVTKAQVGLENVTNDAQLKRSAGDINSFTEKATPTSADIVLVEDSENAYNKVKVQLVNLGKAGIVTRSIETSSNYTATDKDFSVDCDASTSAITIDISGLSIGALICVSKADSSANAVTIDAGTGNNINGSQTYTLSTQYQSVMLQKINSTTWRVR